jgi:simple sugar transport system permease protein
MVAGRGYIALAIVVFGRWTLRGSLAGVAIFGITTALQYWMQASLPRFPFQLLLALPYVVTILALAMLSRTVTPPEWLGKHIEE